jgi:hypothetical protein
MDKLILLKKRQIRCHNCAEKSSKILREYAQLGLVSINLANFH